MSLPDASTIEQASKLNVLNSDGKQVLFGSLIQNTNADTIVVFIRHFFCGRCQAYVMQLATVKHEALEKANKKLIVIGCGDYQPIKTYSEHTEFRGPIYADPSRSLFKLFGLTESFGKTPKNEQKKTYSIGSDFSNAFISIWACLF